MSLAPSKKICRPSARTIVAIHSGYCATNIPQTGQRSRGPGFFGSKANPGEIRAPRRTATRESFTINKGILTTIPAPQAVVFNTPIQDNDGKAFRVILRLLNGSDQFGFFQLS